ncbi:NADase-type glycan-binding domain-containing protein [Tessaracoccus sp. Z1128]
MDQRVPDEYFRPAAESDDVRGAEAHDRLPDKAAVKAVAATDVRDGWAPRAVVTLAAVTLGLAFTVGRMWIFPPEPQPRPNESSTVSASATASIPPDAFAPYDGPVATVQAIGADGDCLEGGSVDGAYSLLDSKPDTIWRCRGRGVDETVTVTFPGPRALVGLRVVNGNTAWTDRYLSERRILTLRWTFSDGSFFEQGLAANNRHPQEVRFPEMVTESMTFTVLEATPPGDDGISTDAVSVSSLEFLGPA